MNGSGIDFLYIAAHGDIGKIEAPDGSGLSRTFLRNTFVEANRGRRHRLKGVLFGSCKFGDADNLIEIMRPAKIRGEEIGNRLLWVAGYGEEIDYTRASLLDIYFYDIFFRTGGRDEITRVRRTLERLDKSLPGLMEGLSLRVVGKQPRGRYRDLVSGEFYVD